MQSKVIAHLLALAFVCLGITSCSVKSQHQSFITESSTPSQAVRTALPTDTAATTVPSTLSGPPPGLRPFDAFQAEVRSYLYAEKFSLLDRLASEVRASKERFPGGAWKLNAFYVGLGGPGQGDNAPPIGWELHINKLEKWLSQSPDSLTAHVAMGETLLNYAWQARGSGLSHTVTEEGWQLYSERVAMAGEVLNDARRLSEKCPHWYVSMLRMAQDTGWEMPRFNQLFDEAVALEPTYYYYHRVKAMNLLPRWHGQPGQWERFIDEASSKLGGTQGAMLYYLVTSHMRKMFGRNFFEQNQVSWPRMKEGYLAVAKTYGTDWERNDEVCHLAALAHDTMDICHRPISRQP